MIQELVKAFLLIFIAEMGDKTQILAMAFATKFPVKKVLLGIFAGSFLNHGLAVILGRYIAGFIPVNTVQIIAGFAFVAFSLWTLKADDDEEEDGKQKFAFGPVITVAAAFFVGELGDKTQMTAITLATDAVYPVAILGGTVSGMIVTGGIGIFVGKKLGAKIPEFTIKMVAASIFMFFGLTKLYQTVPPAYLNLRNILIFAAIIIIAAIIMIRPLIKRRQEGQESALIKKSRELYDYYHQVRANVNNMCHGANNCGECRGNDCIIGHTRTLVNSGLNESKTVELEAFIAKGKNINYNYDKNQALESLRMTLLVVKDDPANKEFTNIHEIRRNLEIILFGKSIGYMNDWKTYIKELKNINEAVARKVLHELGGK